MSNRHEYCKWLGKPVGVSLACGQSVAGILCDIRNGNIFLLRYLYGTQFATVQFPLREVRSITPFPKCGRAS